MTPETHGREPGKPVSFPLAAATMLLAILLYDVMGAIIKYLSQSYPAPQLSMLRNLFGLIPTALILIWSPNWTRAGRPAAIRQWKLVLFRGGVGALAQLSFYLAIFHLQFATATAILFSGPLVVTALSIPILGNAVGPVRWIAVLIGFCGVLMIVQPAAEDFTWYSLLPLCAAFGFAIISVTSRLFDVNVPTALINLYQSVASLVAAIILVFLTSGFVEIVRLEDWVWIVLMGIAGGTAAFCLIAAYRLAEPSSLSPFEYFGIPFSFTLGWVFFAETPFDQLIPGVFLIVGGGLFIIWRERRLKRNPNG